jgi:hypothetical protein
MGINYLNYPLIIPINTFILKLVYTFYWSIPYRRVISIEILDLCGLITLITL